MRIAALALPAAVAAAALAIAGIAGGSAPPRETADAFPRGKAVITTKARRVVLDVEIASRPEQWQLGLMHRTRLPARAGMVFLFPRPTRGGFWMKNTRIPLSIAFFDGRGRILRILDMRPCVADPCRVYEPGVAYRGALEVNRGAFARLGVRRGDVVHVRR
jgi:uncharacterized protein